MAQAYKERRILIIGKTGHGKSATGNTILGKDVFEVSAYASSKTSQCSYERTFRFAKKLVVVDTPGFFDTRSVDDDIRKELIRVCALLSPGFHAVFLILKPERYTRENQEAVEKYIQLFGNEMFDYTFLIFTHWDQIQRQVKSLEDYFLHGTEELKELRSKCGDRVFIFDNNSRDERQVEIIVEAMEKNLKRFNGKCFSNLVFKGIEAFFHQYLTMSKQQKELHRQMDGLSESVLGKGIDIDVMLSSSDLESENAYQERLKNEYGDDERDKLRRIIADGEKQKQNGIFAMLIRFFKKLFTKLVF